MKAKPFWIVLFAALAAVSLAVVSQAAWAPAPAAEAPLAPVPSPDTRDHHTDRSSKTPTSTRCSRHKTTTTAATTPGCTPGSDTDEFDAFFPKISLIKFDISSIPAGSTIVDVTFRAYLDQATGASSVNISMGRATKSWTASSVTWKSWQASRGRLP